MYWASIGFKSDSATKHISTFKYQIKCANAHNQLLLCCSQNVYPAFPRSSRVIWNVQQVRQVSQMAWNPSQIDTNNKARPVNSVAGCPEDKSYKQHQTWIFPRFGCLLFLITDDLTEIKNWPWATTVTGDSDASMRPYSASQIILLNIQQLEKSWYKKYSQTHGPIVSTLSKGCVIPTISRIIWFSVAILTVTKAINVDILTL